MTKAYIYDHVRTPRGKGRPDGKLHEIAPIKLSAQTLAAIRDRSGLDTALIDDVILGCAMPVGEQGADIARLAALDAEFSQTVPGIQLNRFCASGLEAVNLAAAMVDSRQAEAIIGGGVESMSRVAMGSDGGAWYTDPSINWRSYYTPQGIGADLIATQDGFTRDDVDAYAVESQRRAADSWAQGLFSRSVIAVKDVIGETVLDRDEYFRAGTTLADLAKLKPAFADMGEKHGYDAVAISRYPQIESIHHVHTGGNSSGIVDGAAAVLIGSAAFGRKAGIKPRARIRAFTSIGSDVSGLLHSRN